MFSKYLLVFLGIVALGILYLFNSASTTEKNQELSISVGIAKNRLGEELYKETHRDTYDNGKLKERKSEFLDKEGNLIGEIHSDFTHSQILPDYHLINHRGDEMVSKSGARPNVRITYTYLE